MRGIDSDAYREPDVSRFGAFLSAVTLGLLAGAWLLGSALAAPYVTAHLPVSRQPLYYVGNAGILALLGAYVSFRILRRRDRQHEATHRHARRLHTLVRLSADIAWRCNADGTGVTLLHARGGQGDNEPVDDNSRFLLVHRGDADSLREAWQQACSAREPFSVPVRLGQAGNYRWFHCEAHPVLARDGSIEEWLGTCRDIVELVDRDAAHQRDSAVLNLAADAANLITSSWDLRTERLRVSRGWQAQLGLPASLDLRESLKQLGQRIHPEDRPRVMDLLREARSAPRPYEDDVRIRHTDGLYRWFHVRGTVLHDNDGVPDHILGIYWDITDRRNRESEMRRLAYTDELTRLPNRRAMQEALDEAVERARENGLAVGVVCLDIDDFGAINDGHGHAVGDRLIADIAARLGKALEAGEQLCRLDGDQFAVVLADKRDRHDILAAAERIIAALQEPFTISRLSIHVRATAGVSAYPDHTLSAVTLFEYADAAMNKGKSGQRGWVNEFQHRIVLEPSRWLELKNALQSALQQRELYVVYQPIYHLRKQAVTGMEALVRWESPTLGPVSPADFIPVAEAAGFIADVDRYVMREVARQIGQWRVAGRQTVPVSVNLSARYLEQAGCTETIKRILQEEQLDSDAVVLELTETAILHNENLIRDHLSELRGNGFAIAIDDFGTGNCGLQKLPMYGAKRLKIDRSFVQGMLHNSADEAIVNSIIHLARGLDLEVVAEGVETREEQLALQQLDCDMIQGYYFAKPMRPEIVRRYLEVGNEEEGIT